MERKIYRYNNKRIEKMNYLLYVPENKSEKLPMIVFLHGAGERGDDFDKIAVHGVPKYVERGMDIPAIVIAPQCPQDFIWNRLTVEVKELIDFAVAEYGADPERISITGLSMGGYGTWEMGMAYPGFFAALAPVCGGGISWNTGMIGKTPVWAFHGDADNVVPYNNSVEMCDTLKAKGGNVRLTLFHGVDHNSWEPAYETTKLIEWLVAAKK